MGKINMGKKKMPDNGTSKTNYRKKEILDSLDKSSLYSNKDNESETLYEMIIRFGLIDLIDFSTSYEKKNTSIEQQKLESKTLVFNTSKIFKKILKRKKKLNNKYRLFIVENYNTMDKEKLYQKLYSQDNFIEYLIYEFIDHVSVLLSYTDKKTPELWEKFVQPNLEKLNITQSNNTNNTNNLQVNYLSNQVAKIYAPENLSKLYKNRFFSSKSFIKLYTLIYNDLYKALHSTSELMHNSDINKLLDSIIAKCSKEIMSMKEEGAIMLCAIALQLPIAYRSMHPRGLPKTKIRQSQNLKKLPLKKNKLSIEINKMINNKENNYAGYRSINHNNKIIKKLKVKKRVTIKKQHKSRKPRKYKSRKSRKYKSRKNKSFRKNN